MIDTGDGSCEVVGCGAPAAGSFLDATDRRSIRFVVCADHLARLRSGERPAIVPARTDLGMLPDRPGLRFDRS